MNHQLFRGQIWNIDKGYEIPLLMKLNSRAPATVLEKLPAELQSKVNNRSLEYGQAYARYFTDYFSPQKNVLVLPLVGEMSRESYWSYGTELLAACLDAASKDDSYVGAVLKVNTPGGTADSCPVLADAVASFGKPIIASANYCASGGVFVSSQADEVWMENTSSSRLGSIGSLAIYENYQKALEQAGIDLTIFRSSSSPDKGLVNAYEPLTEEGKAEIMAAVNAAQKEFAGYVKRGRAGKITSDEVFTGKMYTAKEAISLGLADRTGSLNEAVKAVQKMAKK